MNCQKYLRWCIFSLIDKCLFHFFAFIFILRIFYRLPFNARVSILVVADIRYYFRDLTVFGEFPLRIEGEQTNTYTYVPVYVNKYVYEKLSIKIFEYLK